MDFWFSKFCDKFPSGIVEVLEDVGFDNPPALLSTNRHDKDKHTRWGMKLWVLLLADAADGYTYDFEVYTRKGLPVSKNGLAYDVVMRLCRHLDKQGYHVYFYASVQLVKDLLVKNIAWCGTLKPNRKVVPEAFKDTKVFAKGTRGTMRWKREGDLLFLQGLTTK